MLIIYSMTTSAIILKLKEIMFKNSRHSSHSLYLWSSMIKGLHKEELNSDFFFIVQWIAIQANKENHISHKTFPDQSVSKYMWCTPPSPEILEVPVVCLYYRNQCFNKEDTLWYHLWNQTRWSWEKPKGIWIKWNEASTLRGSKCVLIFLIRK